MRPGCLRNGQSCTHALFIATWLVLALPCCSAAASASFAEGRALLRSDTASQLLEHSPRRNEWAGAAAKAALTRRERHTPSVLGDRPSTASAVISSLGVKFVASSNRSSASFSSDATPAATAMARKASNTGYGVANTSLKGRAAIVLEATGNQRRSDDVLAAPNGSHNDSQSSSGNASNDDDEDEVEHEVGEVEHEAEHDADVVEEDAKEELANLKKKPKKLYFTVAMAIFGVSFVLMVIGMQSLGFRQVEPGTVGQENPQDEDAPAVPSAGPRVTHPGSDVPFRMQQVLISWIHILASIVYFMDFLALQADFGMFRHWCGVVSSTQWLLGFVIQIHWHHSVGDNEAVLVSAYMKAIACVVSNVHPTAMMMGLKESDAGVWWPAFAAIAIWHMGNLIICMGFNLQPPHGSRQDRGWLFHGNLPITEVWIDQVATWCLIVSSTLTTHWLGKRSNELVNSKSWFIAACQFVGATLFLLGSCLHCEWCDGFRNWRHPEPVREVQALQG